MIDTPEPSQNAHPSWSRNTRLSEPLRSPSVQGSDESFLAVTTTLRVSTSPSPALPDRTGRPVVPESPSLPPLLLHRVLTVSFPSLLFLPPPYTFRFTLQRGPPTTVGKTNELHGRPRGTVPQGRGSSDSGPRLGSTRWTSLTGLDQR